MWSTQDLYDNPVTAVFQYEGLWRSCVQQSSGFTECRPYLTILGLPGRRGRRRGRSRLLLPPQPGGTSELGAGQDPHSTGSHQRCERGSRPRVKEGCVDPGENTQGFTLWSKESPARKRVMRTRGYGPWY